MNFRIESVNISTEKGVQKHPLKTARLIADHGIEGDAHAGKWHRQVSLLALEAIEHMRDRAGSLKIKNGDFGENIITKGIDLSKVEIGGRLTIKDVVLEVTQIGKECHSGCAIYDAAGECIMPTQGIFAKVIDGGDISVEDSGNYSLG
ncbi:MAG: MOSC domain-containing protein [Acidobacteriota bacterium]